MKLDRYQKQRPGKRLIEQTLRLLSACVVLTCASALEQNPIPPTSEAESVTETDIDSEPASDGLIIQFKQTATDNDLADALTQGELEPHRHIHTDAMKAHGHHGFTHARTRKPLKEVIRKLRNHPAIEIAEPNYLYTHQVVANDPYFTSGSLWGMCGDTSSPANVFGSQAAEAWNAGFTGSQSVYVGIIDEGIQYNHPDLLANSWTNPFDVVDGRDNDGNRYADDVRGWNFATETSSVYEGSADDHGTHVAGTIAASGGNGLGVVGVNWKVTFISAKFLGSRSGSTVDAIQAIDYFVDLKRRHGLNIVALNNSWGGGGYSQALHDAVLRAAKANILFIAAAGNGDANGRAINTDVTPNYPSCLDTTRGTSTESAATYDAVISVAAIDRYGKRPSWSNYGARTVDLAAPGVGIYSTLPNNGYGTMSGTSMAAPHVTGAAALYASTHPGATALEIKNALLSSVIPTPSLAGVTATGGRLNLSSIVAPAGTPVPPSVPTGLTATAVNSQIDLRWNAVAGASSYIVKRATGSGGPYTTIASGVTSTGYSDTSSTLVRGTRYYYVVSAVNASGTSANSTEASAVLPVSPPTTGIPATPSSLRAAPLSSSQIRLTWTDTSSNETGFKIEVAAPGRSFTQIGTLGVNSTTCTVSGCASKTTYSFRIRAYNSAGNS
ncbi:MAG TPA: S8 family serine peptidase, partial [Clostridia bacterium]|nr:S8 family serine peptidase [Clostridia bacterium]